MQPVNYKHFETNLEIFLEQHFIANGMIVKWTQTTSSQCTLLYSYVCFLYTNFTIKQRCYAHHCPTLNNYKYL